MMTSYAAVLEEMNAIPSPTVTCARDDDAVDVAVVGAHHAAVLHYLPHHAAVPPPNDADVLGVRVHEHGDVRHHLMVCVLVALCALDYSVQGHHLPIRRRLIHTAPLVLRAALEQDLIDLDRHRLSRPLVVDLNKPPFMSGFMPGLVAVEGSDILL
eukprot:CAMPEP_0114175574 /NCGR_PEP_ID=MMETSP0043_2-20121206/37036_1 /TAXON_ID=464988 /ORGANISM="Hemiselmis andersenii, Strain CCMP644" /LENGTH=155 /DNA_ID=CAMNT_0001273835 /DNA_START=90 /DNA_END=555 /DNA_ORIENTATION=+